MEVVDMNRIHGGLHSVFVGGAVDDAGFYACACEPGTEGPWMVFTAFGFGGVVKWGSAEFGGPDDECILEHAALLEIA